MTTNATQARGVPRITVSPAQAQVYRERAQACLGAGFVTGLLAVGIAASGGNFALGLTLGIVALGFLCAFGIVWDLQTARPDEPRIGLGRAVMTIGPAAAACVFALLGIAGVVPPVLVPAALCLSMGITALAKSHFDRKDRQGDPAVAGPSSTGAAEARPRHG